MFLMEALLQVYSWAMGKLSSVDRSAITKGLGTSVLVYIFQTFNVDIKDCLRHPQGSQFGYV